MLGLLGLLLTSCASKSSLEENKEVLNTSALYDPPSVTLMKGREYQFVEGRITGSGQKFHSHYSYLRALTIGQ